MSLILFSKLQQSLEIHTERIHMFITLPSKRISNEMIPLSQQHIRSIFFHMLSPVTSSACFCCG